MTLQDIYDQLMVSELSLLFIGVGDPPSHGVPSGAVPVISIPIEKRSKVSLAIQLGLTELHKRFLIKEGTLQVTTIPNKSSYILSSSYADSNTASLEVKYINDSSDPFKDNLLRIERVYDSSNVEVDLNMIDDEDSITTPSYNSILVPKNFTKSPLRIVYRSNHPILNLTDSVNNPSNVNIDLPSTYLEALLYYVGMRFNTKPGSMEQVNQGLEFMNKFEAACAQLLHQGFEVSNYRNNSRFDKNGWV